MDASLYQSQLTYYDERAPEYEASYDTAYTLADRSIPDPNAYRREAAFLSMFAQDLIRGRAIDIACGTAFLLPHYAPHCCSITLFDQSENMLSECMKKARGLGITDKCTFVRGDFFGHDFPGGAFDSALMSFFLSHLSPDLEQRLFGRLRALLDSEGSFLIADSFWSAERRERVPKEGRQARSLNDGTTFDIYKKYLDEADLRRMEREYAVTLTIVHTGRVFIAVHGAFL